MSVPALLLCLILTGCATGAVRDGGATAPSAKADAPSCFAAGWKGERPPNDSTACALKTWFGWVLQVIP